MAGSNDAGIAPPVISFFSFRHRIRRCFCRRFFWRARQRLVHGGLQAGDAFGRERVRQAQGQQGGPAAFADYPSFATLV